MNLLITPTKFIKLTKPQRRSLYKVYLRELKEVWYGSSYLFPYRDFRRLVQPGPDCIMVFASGIWLGIEPDGYTHS